jgi:hypothetical protein
VLPKATAKLQEAVCLAHRRTVTSRVPTISSGGSSFSTA